MFGQTPYALSLVYSAMAVLIEGRQAGQVGLPVRRRAAHVAFARPFLKEVEHLPLKYPRERFNTITLDSRIILHGRDLEGEGETRIKIGKKIQLTPQALTSERVELNLARLGPPAKEILRAGNWGIQVVRLSKVQNDPFTIESNSLPFILCPQILAIEGQPENAAAVEEEEEGTPFTGTILVDLDLAVEPGQQAHLLINGHSTGNDREYILTAARLAEAGSRLAFAVEELAVGDYLVRVQVDGAVSPLLVNRAQEYAGPMFTIS